MRQLLLAKLSVVNILIERANQEKTIKGEEALHILMIPLILEPVNSKMYNMIWC